MIKIFTAQKESIKLPKPSTLQILLEKICLVYETKPNQLVLTFENDSEEQVLLMTESDYTNLLSTSRDFHLTAYIKPVSRKQTYIILSLASLCLTYILMKYATIKSLSVRVGDNSGFLMYFFFDVFSVLFTVFKAMFYASLWVPIAGSCAHLAILVKNWVFSFVKTRNLKINQLLYLAILTLNYVPNAIGYFFCMFLIGWLCLVAFHVFLHRPKPRTEKDKSFLKTMGLMIGAGVLRLNNFY